MVIAAPIGTPVDGNRLTIRITDNGTPQSISWNAAFRAIALPLPTTTVANKILYIGCIYNSDDLEWDIVAVSQEV